MAGETYTPIADSELDPESAGTSPLFYKLRDNPIAMFAGAAGAPKLGVGVFSVIPLYSYNGDGADLTVTHSTNTNLDSGEYDYIDYTLNSGITLGTTESKDSHLLIKAQNKVTINGTINLAGKGAGGGAANAAGGSVGIGSTGQFGGTGGGGGADDFIAGKDGGIVSFNNQIVVGGLGKTDVGTGSAGNPPTDNDRLIREYLSNSLEALIGGSGGGGGGGATGGAGGDGGGVVIIVANEIEITATGVIDVRGAAGGTSVNDAGGGGGGGGVVILIAGTITQNGSILTSGGAAGGGIAGYNGAVGGAGYSTLITVA